MRTDVKLGFVIGGVLLAVMIVYVVVIGRGGSTVPDQTADLVVPDETQMVDGASTSVPRTTAIPDEPVVATGPTDSVTLTTVTPTAPVETPVATVDTTNSLTVDSTTSTQGAQTGRWNWDKLLTDGADPAPLMSSALNDRSAPDRSSSIGASSNATPTDVTPVSYTAPVQTDLRTPALTDPVGPVTPVPTTVIPGSTRTHTVKPGETLSSIAQAAYGSSKHWPAIAKANPSIDPNRLKPRTVLTLPDPATVNTTHSTNATTSGNTTTSSNTTGPGTSPATVVDPARQYKVQPGDSLHKIAAKLYGDANIWQKIYDTNKTGIGADPAKLKVGAVLNLPEKTSTAPTAN